MNTLSPLIKKEEKDESNKSSIVPIKLKVFKFIDPINFHRISSDFIIPDKFEKFKDDDLVYLFELMENFKYIKQIHVRKNGIILEYDYYDPNTPNITTLNLLKERLESLGNKDYFDLAQQLNEFEKYNIKQKKFINAKNNEKTSLFQIYDHFDNLFFRNKKEKFSFMANEIYSEHNLSLRFMGFNFKIINDITWEEDPNFCDENFLEKIQKIMCFKGMKNYLNTIQQYMFNVIHKFEKKNENNDVFYYQYYNSIVGGHYSKVKIIEEVLKEEKLIIYGLIIENNIEEQVFSYFLETKKKEFNKKNHSLNEEKNFKNRGELLKLYYKKKKI